MAGETSGASVCACLAHAQVRAKGVGEGGAISAYPVHSSSVECQVGARQIGAGCVRHGTVRYGGRVWGTGALGQWAQLEADAVKDARLLVNGLGSGVGRDEPR